jgi:2-aminoadipate transaminase
MNTLSIAKEAMGLHSSVVDQLAVARYLEHYDVDGSVAAIASRRPRYSAATSATWASTS